LHPEPITFFDLKSQNKNCFSGLAPNLDLALPVSSGRLGNINMLCRAGVGNTHHGKTGKIIAARFGFKDDKYIIALDRKSRSVRELTIKIPKGCKLTYLKKL